MKKTKKIAVIAIAVAMMLVFSATVFADETPVRYFNAEGFRVNIDPDASFFRNQAGNMIFGGGCWYVDADGNVVNAWGYRVFDENGNIITGQNERNGSCCGGARRGWGANSRWQ